MKPNPKLAMKIKFCDTGFQKNKRIFKREKGGRYRQVGIMKYSLFL